MDKVRLGRALGYGTRHAAKTLAAVAEAATAPDPRKPGESRTPEVLPAEPARPVNAERAARVPRPRQIRGAGKSVWAPLATFSSALWLRVTGLFFALIALVMANGAWRARGAVHNAATDPGTARHFWIFTGCAVVFAYFAVTGFMRASLRERRAAQAGR